MADDVNEAENLLRLGANAYIVYENLNLLYITPKKLNICLKLFLMFTPPDLYS